MTRWVAIEWWLHQQQYVQTHDNKLWQKAPVKGDLNSHKRGMLTTLAFTHKHSHRQLETCTRWKIHAMLKLLEISLHLCEWQLFDMYMGFFFHCGRK